MNSLLLFLVRLLDFYTLIVFFYVVVSWLFHFNILNSQNVFLWKVFESFKKLTDPPLNYIRRYLPNFGGIDISPVLLILLIYLFKDFSDLKLFPIRGRISSPLNILFAGRWKKYIEKTNFNMFLDKFFSDDKNVKQISLNIDVVISFLHMLLGGLDKLLPVLLLTKLEQFVFLFI